jgi:hypothetical protein
LPPSPFGASLVVVAIVAGIVGALVGAVVGVVLTEILFANNAGWPDFVPFALAVLGWLVGTSSARRARGRNLRHVA